MKYVFVVLAVLYSLPSFAYDWITNPANGHKYAKISDNLDWAIAEEQAVSSGGHLVTINDVAENEWVRTTFWVYNFNWMWIGLHEQQPWGQGERTWVWSSGETPSYLNWGDGEPSSSAEHYVAMEGLELYYGKWADLAAGWGQPIVHIGVVEVVPEPLILLVVLGGAFLFALRRQKASISRSLYTLYGIK